MDKSRRLFDNRSKTFNISIDELLNNNVKNLLVEKVSNTEKLARLILKALKWLGAIFLVLLTIEIIVFIILAILKIIN